MKINKRSNDKPIVFIHIPKTAGTSFRKAADSYFGTEKCCRDYGTNSAETSKIVLDWMINHLDPWRFKNSFYEEDYEFCCGHVPARKYIQIFGVERSVTFLREPVQRIVSEYKHHVRHKNYTKSFEKFYRADQFINRQTKMLEGIPWGALGFIGITEQYAASIDLFNSFYGVNFPKLEENLGKDNIIENHDLSPLQKQELRELNTKDLELYAQVCEQLKWREKLSGDSCIYVRGMISGLKKNNRLNGWAVYDEGEDPLKIEIFVKDRFAGEATAYEARPFLQAIGIKRGGFVGFSLDNLDLAPGDKVEAFVAETGQPLANSPWRVPKD